MSRSAQRKERRADDPTVHYHLGLAYEKVNQPAQAAGNWSRQ